MNSSSSAARTIAVCWRAHRTIRFFLEKLKKLFIDRLIANIDDEPIRDKHGFLVFVHVFASGLIELYTLYLKSEIDLSLSQVNEEINKMFLAGIRLYQ